MTNAGGGELKMNENKSSIITAGDLSNVTPVSRLEGLLRSSVMKKLSEKPFENIMKTIERRPTANTSTTTPTLSTEPPLNFDEAFSRFRIMLGILPAHQRQKMLPILVERMAKRVRPEDVEDFKTLAYGMLEENGNKSDVLERYLPILLILSMMRSG
jgi:hypothetical protein